MRTNEPALNSEVAHVLMACHEYWSTEPVAVHDRVICYKWVRRPYEARFGMKLTRAAFDRAARSGFLEKADTARGGRRRYYRIADPAGLDRLLASVEDKNPA
jgi:hypothetical protein